MIASASLCLPSKRREVIFEFHVCFVHVVTVMASKEGWKLKEQYDKQFQTSCVNLNTHTHTHRHTSSRSFRRTKESCAEVGFSTDL